MAFTRTIGNDEYVTQGPLGIAGIATTKRKYDLPGLLTYQERFYAKFDNILRQSMPVIMVSDPEPKVLTRNEAPIKFNIKSADLDTTFEGDTLRVSDTEAIWLQPGDVLQIPQIFCDSDGANYTTTKYDTAQAYFPETVIVESVVESGAGSGVANVFVRRGNGYSTASPGAGTVTTVAVEHVLIKMGNTIADGGNAANPIQFEPFAIQNFCQFFSKTWGETSVESSMDVYGKMTMAEKAVESRKEFFREKEWALFDGRKGKRSTDGKLQYTTGGLVEFVPNASDSIDGETRLIDFGGAFNLDRQREIDEITYRYGSETKDWFCGGQYFTVLNNNLEKFITVNDAFSKKYGWTVSELSLGHGVAHLHRHPKFTDQHTTGANSVAYAKDCVIADTKYLNLMVMKDHDVQVRSNIQGNRSHKREDEIFCMIGLYRRFANAHSVIWNITA